MALIPSVFEQKSCQDLVLVSRMDFLHSRRTFLYVSQGAILSGADDILGFCRALRVCWRNFSKFLFHQELHCAHFGFETGQAELNVDFIMLLWESVVLSMAGGNIGDNLKFS